MQDPWYSSPVFVVPVIWVLFLSGVLWGTQALARKKPAAHDDHAH
jgi:hypothetical protein